MRGAWACGWVLLILVLAGCAVPGDADTTAGAPTGGAVVRGEDCRITLHVWLVQASELATKTPPEFPPTPYRGESPVDTPLARLVFYLYDCADATGGMRTTLGLLGARVTPPAEVAPPSNGSWATMYELDAWADGAPTGPLGEARIPAASAVASIEVASAADGVASATASLTDATGARLFGATGQSLPGQIETFARPERYYFAEGGDVRWVDVDFNTTLYESEGRVEYADDSAWGRAVGRRAYDGAIDHHIMVGTYSLRAGGASGRATT